MKVYIVGVDAGRRSGLLASPYMERELHALGYDVELLPATDASGLRRSLLAGANPGSLILVPLTGSAAIDSACVSAAAELCGKSLIENEEVASSMEKRGRLSADEAAKFSRLPQGARIFPCRQSLIPGFELAGDDFHVIVLPSDPEEQTSLFFSYLFQILSKTSTSPCHSRVLRIMEMNLDTVENALSDLIQSEIPCVAIYEKRSEIIIRISDNHADRQKAAENCSKVMRTIVQRLGTHVYGIDVNGIEHALALKCAKKNLRIAFAESGSAGLAAKRFGKVDSDSQLIYSTYNCQPEDMDLEKIGINDKIGKKFGPVSANVAAAMALGASKQEDKDLLGLSITLPNAAFKTRKAYIAAVLNGACLMEELDAGNYNSLTQMASDAVAKVFNMARKLADSYPQTPEGCCDAEEAVLTGMGVVPASESTGIMPAPSAEAAKGKRRGKKQNKKNLAQEAQKPAPKAPRGFKGIIYRIFPNRDDSGFDKVRKLLMWICLCVFSWSMFYLVDFGLDSKKSQDNIANLQDQMAQAEKDVEEGKVNASNIEGYPNDYLPKFYSFYKQNEDIKGWLKIDNTNVNFPVVQTSNNDYYHRLGFDKEYDYYGTPYIDYEVDVQKPSTNIIIYGHNIRNDGQMFNDLTKYKQLSYYKERPTVTFDSVYKSGTYKIFAAFITNTNAAHDNGNVFDYNHFVDAKNEQKFNEFVDEVKRRSIFDTPVDVEYGDELLTLSTCTYEFKEARFVLVARRVRDGEDASVDTSQAVVNDDAYYPAVYAGAAEYAKKLGKVKGISIQGGDITLEVGQTATLKAQVTPADAPIQTCTWDSSNTEVATIDKNTGVVTAIAPGTTKITAAADDGGFVNNITVTVKGNGKELTGISLNNLSLSMKPEDTSTLTAVLEPKEAQASLKWKSSDENVIRVTGSGASVNLTAVNPGTAEVTVSTSDGKFEAVCKITVAAASTDKDNPTIAFAQNSMTLTVDQLKNIQLVVSPSGADIGNVSWQSSSEAIGVKSGYTGLDADVLGMQPGQAVLTATTSTGLTASCTITVIEENSNQETNQVKLSINPLVLNPGEGEQLRFIVEPQDTALVWSSDNPHIADVDQDGYVTTISSLSETTDVTITATTKDGKVSAKTIVTVVGTGSGESGNGNNGNNNGNNNNGNNNNGQEGDFELSAYGTEVDVDSSKYIDIVVGLREEEVSVKCSSSDNSIARVDNNGMVTGISSGDVTITITATNINTGESRTVTVPVTVNQSGGWGTYDDPTPDENYDQRN